jgi:hypothetical protein
LARGERGTVIGVKDGRVELAMPGGEVRRFDPDRLPRNLQHDAVTIFERKDIALHQGDRIRWTAKDGARGLLNGDIAHVARIDGDTITVTASDGKLHDLQRGDRMLERLDLAYAINVHVAQGMTAQNGIIMMSERERMLNTSASFLVAVTRIAENATLVTDNPARVERQVGTQAGEKTSAIETAKHKKPEQTPPIMTEDLKRLGATLGAEYVWAVLTNKERDITEDKPMRGTPDRDPDRDRLRDRERFIDRDLERGR